LSTEKIFVTLSTFAEFSRRPLELLEESGAPFELNPTGKRVTPEQLLEQGREATVLVAGVETYDEAVLSALPRLRCISRCGVGTDAIDLAAARARRVTVLNTPDPPTQAVAELALSMILALSRQLLKQSALVSAGQWVRLPAHLVSGRSVGIVGLGRIGRRVAELLTPFGAELVGSDPFVDPKWAEAHRVRLVPLDTLLRSCDVVTLHAARSADRPLYLGAAELASMKTGAILINLARGGMVDEASLYEALRSGALGGAGLDVYAEEPYRGPLCELGNVVLTPHTATLTVETRTEMETQCIKNALAFLAGDPPATCHVV
jgi:D-3-phosphoglycerate dehydrogenase